MNGLMGMTALLLDTKLDAEQRGWADIIKKSGENLLEIINDILDFSKIESGILQFESIVFHLPNTLMEVTDLLALKAQENGIELLVNLPTDLPTYVRGDPTRLRQILLNVTGNAVKFTKKGYVLIRVQWEEDREFYHFRFAIEDTGIGIPEDKVEHIFQKFSQAEESTTRNFGGTGLGLSISSKLAELMGGSLRVSSTSPHGSVFTFDVELMVADKKIVTPPRIPDCDLSGLRMLAVDDLDINLQILIQYTNSWNMRCDVCKTSAETLVLMKKSVAENDPYHFVLIDHLIDDMNAAQLATMIKSSPIPFDAYLILITALGPFGIQSLPSQSEVCCVFHKTPVSTSA